VFVLGEGPARALPRSPSGAFELVGFDAVGDVLAFDDADVRPEADGDGAFYSFGGVRIPIETDAEDVPSFLLVGFRLDGDRWTTTAVEVAYADYLCGADMFSRGPRRAPSLAPPPTTGSRGWIADR
jgi:hypothetical protein